MDTYSRIGVAAHGGLQRSVGREMTPPAPERSDQSEDPVRGPSQVGLELPVWKIAGELFFRLDE
jgi:hypothetical protein